MSYEVWKFSDFRFEISPASIAWTLVFILLPSFRYNVSVPSSNLKESY